jgi:glycyl-tRNA synthetase
MNITTRWWPISREKSITCPGCGKSVLTDIRKFNLMFKTSRGSPRIRRPPYTCDPENAQGFSSIFQNVQRTTRKKVPFGVCQIGKSFRNEITPGQLHLPHPDFEQMELEFFCKPGTVLQWFEYWRTFCRKWAGRLGMQDTLVRLRDHEKEELSHYSNATTDFEFLFPSAGVSCGALPPAPNSTSNAHQTTRAGT